MSASLQLSVKLFIEPLHPPSRSHFRPIGRRRIALLEIHTAPMRPALPLSIHPSDSDDRIETWRSRD
jgi:hypothetical protein